MQNQISVNDQDICILFDKWDQPSYDLFLRAKKLPEYTLVYDWHSDSYTLKTPSRFAHLLGVDVVMTDRGFVPFAAHLREYQKFVLNKALSAKRFACWSDTSTGKTPIFLEFSRQVQYRTGGKVLIISPLNIMQQTLDQASDFYGESLPITRLDTKDSLKGWCQNGVPGIAITNPEKFIPHKGEPEVIHEITYCAGVCLDEASLLKASGGKIKWSIIKSCRGVEYKLALTATPAPNDTLEYASQGAFLEKLRSEGEIIWTYFARDKEGNWKVKDHAKDAFYRFMAGWSIYMRNPANYGFENIFEGLPDPDIKQYALDITPEQQAHLTNDFRHSGLLIPDVERLSMPQRIRYSEIAKGFLYDSKNKPVRVKSQKPGFVANLVKRDVGMDGLQGLVWTLFDEEAVIIAEHLSSPSFSFEILTGKMKDHQRVEIIERFRKGKLDALISKASLLGYGLNFPMCGSMVFSGIDDSYERFYQATRRAYRWGQTRVLRVHIPFIPELEGTVWRNVQSKQERFLREVEIQEQNYINAMKEVPSRG